VFSGAGNCETQGREDHPQPCGDGSGWQIGPSLEVMSLEIKLSRNDRLYRPGEPVKGHVVLHSRGQLITHDGVHLHSDGLVTLQQSSKSVGLFEAFYSASKPLVLFNHDKELAPPGKISTPEPMQFSFEFELTPAGGETLQETYHGVFINIQYCITVEVRQRSMMSKGIKRQLEFVVEVPSKTQHKPQLAPFALVPESLENIKKSSLRHVPTFKVSGKIDTVVCNIANPLVGEVTIEQCSARIKSIELQLVRVEICTSANGSVREATEIQNIQIADGDVCHGWAIPIHMVFPRLFTCPTVAAKQFKVDFELNLVMLFTDGHLLTENFPLRLVRATVAA